MRDKEAIETERKNLSRNLEKQAKVIEKLQESEKSLMQQVVSAIRPFHDLSRILTTEDCRASWRRKLSFGRRARMS
jgi:hypothetical protein